MDKIDELQGQAIADSHALVQQAEAVLTPSLVETAIAKAEAIITNLRAIGALLAPAPIISLVTEPIAG